MNELFEISDGVLLSCASEDNVIDIPDGVHTIGEGVFRGRSWITKVTLPNTLRVIGADAFKGCRKLNDINFPASLERIEDSAFRRCHSLESAILPDSVSYIGKCAFLYCDKMQIVSIKGIKKLERQTFANCTELRELHLNSSLETANLNDDIFTGCVKINRMCFSDGRTVDINDLISVIISDNSVDPIVNAVARGVYNSMRIEDGVLLKFCVNLKEIYLPEGIKCIEKSCFYDKKGAVSVEFPRSLERIKANAFGNCINLERIRIQSPDIVIDDRAFKGCCNLSEVILWDGRTYSLKNILAERGMPGIVRTIGEQILSDFYISGNTLMKYRGSEERVTVPYGVKIIAESCFEGNDKLGRVILPDTVSEIRENAFRNCTSMQTIELSEKLTVIERGAFENCCKLLKITLPDTVEKLGESAFKRCFKLKEFCMNESLRLVGDMAFWGCRELKRLDIPENTRLDGELIFYRSGIGITVEKSESRRVYTAKDIPPYKFCKSGDVKTLRITEPCIIGKYAFSACQNLTELEIDSLECVIGEHAFEKCTSLKTVKIRARSVGKAAFAFCRNLESVSVAAVGKIADEAFIGCEKLGNAELSADVRELGKSCFEECISLKSFDFSHVEHIGERAFARCDGLENIELHDVQADYHAFEDCCALGKITLSSDVVLKSGVFSGCTNVKKIIFDGNCYEFDSFSQSINSISNAVSENVQEIIASIYSCFSVSENYELLKYNGNGTDVKIPRDISAICDEAFRNCMRLTDIDIPRSVRYIGKLAFAGTGWLEKMRARGGMLVINDMLLDASNCGKTAVVPADIRLVCSWAFSGNTELSEVHFMGGKTAVDEFAFRNCFNLKRVTDHSGKVYELDGISVREDKTLPENIRNIFIDCLNCFKTDSDGNLIESTGNIKNLAFVNGIRAIGDEVYKDCNLLETIRLSADTEVIGKSAFENSKWLREVRGAEGVRHIGDRAFGGCQSLEIADFSENLEHIGKRCFEHCCNLREIKIPEGITEIRERTFFRCKSLKRVVLPSTLKIIEKEAFLFCDMLEEVVFGNPSVQIGERAFGGTKFEIQSTGQHGT